jgi:membrane-bound lytic murein transglycosylase D
MLKSKAKVIATIMISGSLLTTAGCSLQQHLEQAPSQKSFSKGDINSLALLEQATHSPGLNLADNTLLVSAPLSVNEQSVDLVDDVWTRLRDDLSFDLSVDNKAVRVQRNWYARHPEYFVRVAKRANRYLYHVAETIKAQGMPADLALLPIVESAYDPFAYSHGRASGMWQFIPATGKRFGLHQDWWYDGRRDVVKSTEAALAYLTYLHQRFDQDWLLALAAYNSGEGNVNKAIRKNRKQGKPTDFWSLELPKETKDYVPKMIALAQLLQSPEKYGVEFPEIANAPYFETVDVGSQIDMAQAADMAEISLDELYLLNPGFNQWATRPDGPHLLNVPVEKAPAFKVNLSNLPPEKRVNWVRYKIQPGDSISVIASRYKTTSKVLRDVNGMSNNQIRAGKVLFVPVASKGAEQYVLTATERLKTKQNRNVSSSIKKIHIAQPGDSYWDIARKYGVTTRQLVRWNNLGIGDTLRVGQKLVVWSKAGSTNGNDRQVIRRVAYKVRNGDSLARIAQKFNVTIGDIESWNGISRKKYLQPGQPLKLYVDITQASL